MFKLLFVVLAALVAFAAAAPYPEAVAEAAPAPAPAPAPKPLVASVYSAYPSVYSAYVPALGYSGLYV